MNEAEIKQRHEAIRASAVGKRVKTKDGEGVLTGVEEPWVGLVVLDKDIDSGMAAAPRRYELAGIFMADPREGRANAMLWSNRGGSIKARCLLGFLRIAQDGDRSLQLNHPCEMDLRQAILDWAKAFASKHELWSENLEILLPLVLQKVGAEVSPADLVENMYHMLLAYCQKFGLPNTDQTETPMLVDFHAFILDRHGAEISVQSDERVRLERSLHLEASWFPNDELKALPRSKRAFYLARWWQLYEQDPQAYDVDGLIEQIRQRGGQ